MGTDELARELGISPSALRAWLRREFPRSPEEQGRPWRLQNGQIEAARSRWCPAEALARSASATRETADALLAPEPAPTVPVPPRVPLSSRTFPPDLTAARLAEARRHTAEAATRARHRREAARAGREPVSRAAEALAAGLAIASLIGGLLLRGAFADGPPAALGAGGGLIVAAIGLDLYARAVGAWAARDQPLVAAACALVGSPAVLGHALGARRGPLGWEIGALAGLLVPIVCVVLVWASAG
jgi:hypothetical protein